MTLSFVFFLLLFSVLVVGWYIPTPSSGSTVPMKLPKFQVALLSVEVWASISGREFFGYHQWSFLVPLIGMGSVAYNNPIGNLQVVKTVSGIILPIL